MKNIRSLIVWDKKIKECTMVHTRTLHRETNILMYPGILANRLLDRVVRGVAARNRLQFG